MEPIIRTKPSHGLLVMCAAAFLVPFMGSAINLALPQIGEAFSMKAVTLTWMATVYLISTAIFQIPFARVADMVGRKKVFTAGVLLFSLATLGSGFSTTGHVLIILRFLSGVGSAMLFGTNIAIITSLFPGKSRGKALGINSAVVYAALAAGPFVGGMLTHYLGWRSIFFVTAAAGVLVLVLTLAYIKDEWSVSGGEKFDLKGSILYGAALAGIIYGFSKLPSPGAVVCLVTGAAALALFIWYELRQPFPVFNVRLFSGNKIFALSTLAALVNYAANSAIAFMLSLYLQYVREMDARQAGLILISQALVQSVFSLLAGNMTALISSSLLSTVGMSISVAGLGGLIFLGATTPVWILIIILVTLGMGFGIFSSPNTNVIMGSVEKKDYTQASAATGTVRLAGQAFSMGIASMAISIWIGNSTITAALYPQFMLAMRVTFIIFMALCGVGIYASCVRSRVPEQ